MSQLLQQSVLLLATPAPPAVGDNAPPPSSVSPPPLLSLGCSFPEQHNSLEFPHMTLWKNEDLDLEHTGIKLKPECLAISTGTILTDGCPLTLSVDVSLSIKSSPLRRWISPSLILMTLISSISCCRNKASLLTVNSFCFSSWSLVFSSVMVRVARWRSAFTSWLFSLSRRLTWGQPESVWSQIWICSPYLTLFFSCCSSIWMFVNFALSSSLAAWRAARLSSLSPFPLPAAPAPFDISTIARFLIMYSLTSPEAVDAQQEHTLFL